MNFLSLKILKSRDSNKIYQQNLIIFILFNIITERKFQFIDQLRGLFIQVDNNFSPE